MSAPFRFLGLAVFAWAGVRAASLGLFPGSTALVPQAQAANAAPLRQSTYADVMTSTAMAPQAGYYPPAGYPPAGFAPPYGPQPYFPSYGPPQAIVIPAAYAAAPTYYRSRGGEREPDGWDQVMTLGQPLTYAPLGEGQWPFPTGISPATPVGGGGLSAASPPPGPARLDRWQLSAWALLRNAPGATSLATGGMLGGSQGGARLTYRFNRQIAANVRFASALGGRRGAEAAAGIRWQPLTRIPIAINLERRQGLGTFGGRSALAAFLEGGVYQRKITGNLRLDAYAQAGMVGARNRDWFADGSVAVSHPVWKRVSAGMGIWAGGQSDDRFGALYRVDAGPRLSVDMLKGVRMHLDYRQRLVGNALPNSGPAVTIASDF